MNNDDDDTVMTSYIPPAPLSKNPLLESACWLALGVALGSVLTWKVAYLSLLRKHLRLHNDDRDSNDNNDSLSYEQRKRKRLPDLVILVRHGESEGNIDKTMWWEKPDNQISLTQKGKEQATAVGKRIETIFQRYENTLGISIQKVHIHASPFLRTIQTAKLARSSFEHRVVRQNLCPRLREQEFGNTQSADFQQYRQEQKRVGRFWYRFPTGESGADVFDRIKSWWEDSLLNSNERWGYSRVNAAVVFSHGLTMRFCLMQLYSWSPTTFHAVYNVPNCGIYVLRKNLSIPGTSPYVLDPIHGDVPESSIDILTTFRSKTKAGNDGMQQRVFKLHDYLNIPPPRMTRIEIVKEKLAAQYLDEIASAADIQSITFMPFNERKAPDSVVASREQITVQARTSVAVESLEDKAAIINANADPLPSSNKNIPEASHRWPLFDKQDDV